MFKIKFIFLLFVLIFTFLSLNFLFNYKILVNNFLAKFGYEIVSISLKEQEIKLIKEQLTNIIIDKDKSINALKNEIFSLEYHNDKIINDHLDNFEYVKVNNNKNKNIKLFKNNLFKSGINGLDTESFYLSINNQYLYFLSAAGIIGKSDINIMKADKFEFKKIKSNLLDLISTNNFILNNDSSTKDLVVTDEYIYVSYTKELSENCWNTSLAAGKLNDNFINFQNIFVPDSCVKENNEEKEFHMTQSGGKISLHPNGNIFLSVGDYRHRSLSQDKSNPFGKLLKIDTSNKINEFEIISLGNRNIQGIFFDNFEDKIYMTEHGPKGGDEINIINLMEKRIYNFGWPISSYGEHYVSMIDGVSKYDKYPLHKSHKDYGFIEPIKFFVPSIGIKDIIKIDSNRIIVSSLRAKSIFIFEIVEFDKVSELKKIEIGQRIRDMDLYGTKLFLSLESENNIAVVDIEDLF